MVKETWVFRRSLIDSFNKRFFKRSLQYSNNIFSNSSYGFRPGRSAHQAIKQAQEYVREDRLWVVDIDLAKFFDRVNHDILMSRVIRS
ncbi:MAG: reverse transcriptase domain-containing protein [bacterium]